MNPNTRLPRSSPGAQGIPAAAIHSFLDGAEETLHYLNSFMLVRHGHVVAEGWWRPYRPDIAHMLFSLSKSFTSAAVGLAVDEGLLSIDDAVLSFFPDEAPDEVSENLAAMRVRHLLAMNTGHGEDSLGHVRESADENWARTFLAQPVEHEPGTYFLYDSGATYMLSAIVQKLSGQTLVEYLRPRLFEPLGIQDPVWECCPRGINTGGWGLSISTEDIACFGQLLLQGGVWNGQRILPAEWIETAAAYHSDNSRNDSIDWQQGYGFQFWRCQHDAYRGDGAFGQFCVVMPEQDAVFAATAGVGNMQAVLDLVWEKLLPAMQTEALQESAGEVEELRRRLECLEIAPLRGQRTSWLENSLAGREFRLEENEQGLKTLAVSFDDGRCVLTLGNARGQQEVVCGRGAWTLGSVSVMTEQPQRVAASGTWIDDKMLALQLCFYETPHIVTYLCRFDDDTISVDGRVNVAFGPMELPSLKGRTV